jgi:phage terminase large subunit-like protein
VRILIQHVSPESVGPIRMIAIGVDPAGSTTGTCGIVVAGLTESWKCPVLADASCSGAPAEWAKVAIELYVKSKMQAYLIVETNYGGLMCKEILEQAAYEHNIRPQIIEVPARQSKLGRAHPVSLLYQKGEVVHVGVFPGLETEMTTYGGRPGEKSPNRLDALVHAIGFLMLGGVKGYGRPGISGFNLY